MNKRWIAGAAVFVASGMAGPAFGEAPPTEPTLPNGLTAHVRSVSGGQIDWGGGYIIAEGLGKAEGRTEADRARAKRAAETVAARNAILIALGVQIDGNGRFADIRDGEVTLQGVVKNHETVFEDWRPNATPPEITVKVRVPVWGVEGVASIVYADEVRKSREGGRQRVTLSTAAANVSDAVLIIDARGTGAHPCLFPVVTETGGTVVYDVGSITPQPAVSSPPIRYAETKLTEAQLRAGLDLPRADRLLARSDGLPACSSGTPGFSVIRMLSYEEESEPAQASWREKPWNDLATPETPSAFAQPIPAATCLGMQPPPVVGHPRKSTSQPTSGPTTKPGEAPRRRKVVKAAQATGASSTEIVLTKEDAEKLRKDPEGAALLRSGQVIVVVDSVAAGIEGRHEIGVGEDFLASSR